MDIHETPEERIARLAARSAARRQQTAGAAAPRSTPPPATGRRHAARGSRATALALSAGTTLSLAGYFKIAAGSDSADATTSAASTPVDTVPAASTTAASTATASTTVAASSTTAAAAASSSMKNGTYTGGTYTNRWGPVQVQITVAGGRITAVNVLQVPNSNQKDVSINNRAVPVLVEATLTAQSANISSVSGATYTSVSYKQSLQSAIDAARAAAAR